MDWKQRIFTAINYKLLEVHNISEYLKEQLNIFNFLPPSSATGVFDFPLRYKNLLAKNLSTFTRISFFFSCQTPKLSKDNPTSEIRML